MATLPSTEFIPGDMDPASVVTLIDIQDQRLGECHVLSNNHAARSIGHLMSCACEGRAGACRVVQTLLLWLMVQVGTDVARAQSPELVTDRPDQTESATVVPRGLIQVETGYLFAREGEKDSYEVPGTLFRIGLDGQTELRIHHAGVVGGEGRHGAGDSDLGAKVNLIERPTGWTPELAILGGLSFPTGDDEFSSGGVDPSFLVSFAHELLPRLSLGYNVGAAWKSSGDHPDRDAFIVYSLALGVELTGRLSTFLEFFGNRQTSRTPATSVSVDSGLTVLLTDTVQFDVYGGSGLRGHTEDLFVGTGLSFRFPR